MLLVWIPTHLRRYTNDKNQVGVQGRTLRELIDNLDAVYPGLKQALVRDGLLREEIAVAIDGELSHQGLFEDISNSKEVHFIPTIGGGAEALPSPEQRESGGY